MAKRTSKREKSVFRTKLSACPSTNLLRVQEFSEETEVCRRCRTSPVEVELIMNKETTVIGMTMHYQIVNLPLTVVPSPVVKMHGRKLVMDRRQGFNFFASKLGVPFGTFRFIVSTMNDCFQRWTSFLFAKFGSLRIFQPELRGHIRSAVLRSKSQCS